MIEGVVNAVYEAVIRLPLRDPSGQTHEVDAVIDTGYSGYLTLPPVLVAELRLPFQGDGRAVLANGSEETFEVYGVTALWDGQPRYIDVDAVGATPLAGMLLLERHDLHVEVVDGGRVAIQARES